MEIIETNKNAKSEIIWEGILQPQKIINKNKQYFAIVDSNVLWFYKEYFSKLDNIVYYTYKDPDEDNKTIKTVESILDFLFTNNADRNSIVLAIGGGVTLDLSGFVASIYKRGIDWIAIPTTLLSQVDASVGGKTAINNITGKNAIGSFHPPYKVLISSIVSQSWNEIHRLEGKAEMFKIFKVFDHSAADDLINDPVNDVLTHRSIKIKADVVRIDPWEKDIRASLNYGHTLGHSLEFLMPIRHGIAVALGIRCENYIAEIIGRMSTDVRKAIDIELNGLGFDIPKEMPKFSSLAPFILQDKKNESGEIKLVLIDGVHEIKISNHDPRITVALDEIEKSYKEFCREFKVKEVDYESHF
jgi:3-dehydroquinate synthase